MAQWVEVAEGTSLWDLKETVADFELQKGDKMRVIMDLKLPVGWAFDAAGAELLFKPFVPDGMDLIDVYGEGSQGIVEMKADPVWLLAAVAFIKAHWIALTIATLLLVAIIAYIRIMVRVSGAAPEILAPIAIIGGAILIGALIYSYKGRLP